MISMGRTEVKRTLGRPKRGKGNDIKMDLHEMAWGGIDVAQDRERWRGFLNVVMNRSCEK